MSYTWRDPITGTFRNSPITTHNIIADGSSQPPAEVLEPVPMAIPEEKPQGLPLTIQKTPSGANLELAVCRFPKCSSLPSWADPVILSVCCHPTLAV